MWFPQVVQWLGMAGRGNKESKSIPDIQPPVLTGAGMRL